MKKLNLIVVVFLLLNIGIYFTPNSNYGYGFKSSNIVLAASNNDGMNMSNDANHDSNNDVKMDNTSSNDSNNNMNMNTTNKDETKKDETRKDIDNSSDKMNMNKKEMDAMDEGHSEGPNNPPNMIFLSTLAGIIILSIVAATVIKRKKGVQINGTNN